MLSRGRQVAVLHASSPGVGGREITILGDWLYPVHYKIPKCNG